MRLKTHKFNVKLRNNNIIVQHEIKGIDMNICFK